jgi:hypothetical protein
MTDFQGVIELPTGTFVRRTNPDPLKGRENGWTCCACGRKFVEEVDGVSAWDRAVACAIADHEAREPKNDDND